MTASFHLATACRSCGDSLEDFLACDPQPVAGTYLRAEDRGEEPLVPLTAARCASCGLVQLREVIAPEVYQGYLFSGSGSAGYRSHLAWAADRVIGAGAKDGAVIEVGCSDGSLLELLRDRGGNRVFGFEPSIPMREACTMRGIEVTGDLFSTATAGASPLQGVDAVIARHVLEHIDELAPFLEGAAAVLAPGGALVLEVPDAGSILERGLYAHLYHEHLCYFDRHTLASSLARHGFAIESLEVIEIHSGSLFAICRRGNAAGGRGAPPSPDAWHAFATAHRAYFAGLRAFVEERAAAGTRLAGYGGAHRTAVMSGLAALDASLVPYTVDRNERLHGLYVPGSHIPIRPVEALERDRPDEVLLFASSFEREIVAEQQPLVDAGTRFVSLLPEPRVL